MQNSKQNMASIKCSACKKEKDLEDMKVECSCGDFYCHDCFSIISEGELQDILEEAAKHGHVGKIL